MALRIGFAYPVDERNEFPQDWVDLYTKNGLMLRDPTVRWAYENSGTTRWSDLADDDSFGVLKKARQFGLRYGIVICYSSLGPKEQKSYGTFARKDREFTDSEVAILTLHLRKLHDSSTPPGNLTSAELEALRLVKEGLRLKEIAYHLGVSEGAIKQRLAGAKRKFGAKTNAHAATMATEFRLI
ncbi:MAG: autoinducer binding domain-containing protein [Paracoccaceae bacterium]